MVILNHLGIYCLVKNGLVSSSKESGVLVVNIKSLQNDINETLYLGSSCGDQCKAILPLGQYLMV